MHVRLVCSHGRRAQDAAFGLKLAIPRGALIRNVTAVVQLCWAPLPDSAERSSNLLPRSDRRHVSCCQIFQALISQLMNSASLAC